MPSTQMNTIYSHPTGAYTHGTDCRCESCRCIADAKRVLQRSGHLEPTFSPVDKAEPDDAEALHMMWFATVVALIVLALIFWEATSLAQCAPNDLACSSAP